MRANIGCVIATALHPDRFLKQNLFGPEIPQLFHFRFRSALARASNMVAVINGGASRAKLEWWPISARSKNIEDLDESL